MGYVIYADNDWDVLESEPTNFWTSNSNTLTGIDCNSTEDLMVYTNGSWVTPYSLYLPKPPTDLLEQLRNNKGGGVLFIENSAVNYITISENKVNSNNLYVFDGNALTAYLSFPYYTFSGGGISLDPALTVNFGETINTPIYVIARIYYRLNKPNSIRFGGTPSIANSDVPYRFRMNIYYNGRSSLLVSRDMYVYRSRNPNTGTDYMDTANIQFICPQTIKGINSLYLDFVFPEVPAFSVGTGADSGSYIRTITACISLYTMPY